MSDRWPWIALALAGAVLFAALAFGRGGEITALREALAREQAARESLAREVASLEARIAALSVPSPAASAEVPAVAPPTPSAVGAAAAPTAAAAPPPAPGVQPRRRFEEQALVDAGFRPADAQHLREVYESVDLERLYLRDRATREGWMGTPRFAEESRALEERIDRLRPDLGDDRYDWFLYASGQFNRVLVADVLERSAAETAGIQPGDRILRYGEQRVFSASELAALTMQGRSGEPVVVDVERAGGVQRVTLPRGPIGVRLGAERSKPLERR